MEIIFGQPETLLTRVIWDTPIYDELAQEFGEARAAGVVPAHDLWRLEASWAIEAERDFWENNAPF